MQWEELGHSDTSPLASCMTFALHLTFVDLDFSSKLRGSRVANWLFMDCIRPTDLSFDPICVLIRIISVHMY